MSRFEASTISRRTLLGGAAALVAVPLPALRAGTCTSLTDPVVGFVFDGGGYSLFRLPDPSGDGAGLGAITERGEMAGKFRDRNGIYHGFVRDRLGRYRNIDVPGAMGTYAIKLNDMGQVVGTFNTTSRTVTAAGAQGYLCEGGRFMTIAPPGAVFSQALGINNLGEVVGEYRDQGGVTRGFLWRRGQYMPINAPHAAGTSVVDINDHGDFVGIYGEDATAATIRGFVVSGGRFTPFDLPGREIPFITDINNDGQIAGTAIRNPADPNTYRGFVLAGPGGPFTQIVPPGSPASFVGGLNDRVQVCGTAANPGATGSVSRPGPATLLGLTV
jgi:probable HAF family extracellular repeat protein